MDFYVKMKQARENINNNFSTMPLAYLSDLLNIPSQLLLMAFNNNDEIPRTFCLELIYPWKSKELKKIFEEVLDIEVESIQKNDAFRLHNNSFTVRLKK